MTRRTFLGAAAGAVLAGATRRLPGEPAAPVLIPAIDTHVHFVDPTRPQGAPWPPKSDTSIYRPHLPDKFAAMTAPYRILGEVVIEASPWLEDNQWILDLARDHTGIVAFIGHLDPGKHDFARNLRRFGANPLFRGIRLEGRALKRVEEPAFRDDLARLADRRFTLDIVSPEPGLRELAGLARRLPALRIVMDHLPFEKWDGRAEAMRAGLAEVAACPNVYAKISNVLRLAGGRNRDDPEFYRPGLDVLWDLFGSQRVLYGSNWPASARTATYDEIYRVAARYMAGRSRAEAEAFYWRNSIAAYDWQPRGAAAALIAPSA